MGLTRRETEEEDDTTSDYRVPLEIHRSLLVSGHHIERDISDSAEIDRFSFFLILMEERLRAGGIG